MPLESQAGTEQLAPAAEEIPVAKPAIARPRVDPEPDKPTEEEILTPTKVKSWGTSLALHGLLLLILAFWYFVPRHDVSKTISTVLGEEGDPAMGGDGRPMGAMEGLDEPLTIEPAPVDQPLTTLSPTEVAIDPAAALKPPKPRNAAGAEGGDLDASGLGEGFGPARFGNGSEHVRGVQVKVGDPQFTLIWDTGVDLDLHVIEPGGSEIYWENRNGAQGGELDVDDIDGFGPENVYYMQGKGPPGDYKWFVHYFGGLAGVPTPTTWKVRIKHKGQIKVYNGRLRSTGLRSKIHTLTVERDAGESAGK
jgi:hypothetical protein